MRKLLQINVSANWGSTGKIAEEIGLQVMKQGWESYIAYGRYCNPSKSKLIKIGNVIDVYEHYAENLLFDNEGFASKGPTRKLISIIEKIQPDIIHIHNIHDHYLNYPLLFEFLSVLDKPIVWTQHDCWAYTGGCTYYSVKQCFDWEKGCKICPRRKTSFFDNSAKHYGLKKKLLSSLKNFTIVPVSEWLEKEILRSFLGKYNIYTILNGIDINTFRPINNSGIRDKYSLGKGDILLGIASVWHERKGLNDYLKLSKYLNSNEKIVLVGLSKQQTKHLPSNVIAIPRTQNIEDLVSFYNEASIVLNLSSEETFGLTTVEGLACGTPGIVYNCTASPELITSNTGRIVEKGDIEGVYNAAMELINIGKTKLTEACRQRAIEKYDKNICYNSYITLYNSLLKK